MATLYQPHVEIIPAALFAFKYANRKFHQVLTKEPGLLMRLGSASNSHYVISNSAYYDGMRSGLEVYNHHELDKKFGKFKTSWVLDPYIRANKDGFVITDFRVSDGDMIRLVITPGASYLCKNALSIAHLSLGAMEYAMEIRSSCTLFDFETTLIN